MKYELTNLQCLKLFKAEAIASKLHKGDSDDFLTNQFGHFPVVTDENGKPHVMINLFLINFFKTGKDVSRDTLKNHAHHLRLFYSWCLNEEVDPYAMHKRKLLRPTYKYRIYLQKLIESGTRAPSTCNAWLASVITFYRWLIHDRQTVFENKPWTDRNLTIKYKDIIGNNFSVNVNSTDIAIKVNKSKNQSDEYIYDDGDLRPLKIKEQEIIQQALAKIGNIEKTLMFELALNTGARISTICSLRKSCFNSIPSETQKEIPILIGQGTLINNKNNKRMNIFVSRNLFLKVKTYIESQRWKFRSLNSKTRLDGNVNQYLFITRYGNPYYLHKYDPYIHEYKSYSKGGGIRSFINKQLKPEIKKMGYDFHFRFHDLRGTFGLNLLLSMYPYLNENPQKTILAMKIVQEKLGHSSITSTEKYLRFRDNQIYKDTISEFIKSDEIDPA